MGVLKTFALAFKKTFSDDDKTERPSRLTRKTTRLGTAIVEGTDEHTVYVYYGDPLKGLRRGEAFYADVITEPVRLESELTGGTWDTAENNGYALARDGQIFGASTTWEGFFRELESMGYNIKVRCIKLGTYERNIPEVRLAIPAYDEMRQWASACRESGHFITLEESGSERCQEAVRITRERHRLESAIGRQLPGFTDGTVFIVDDSKWGGPRPQKGTLSINLETRLLPTPTGSSAKPHILLISNDQPAFEASARNGFYDFLARHVSKVPLATTVTRKTTDDGRVVWQIAVAYAG